MVNSDAIYDYFFESGDFAVLATGEIPVRVKILEITSIDGDKYYIVAGPKGQMIESGWVRTPTGYETIEAPTGWVVDVADPDELDPCPKAAHLSLI